MAASAGTRILFVDDEAQILKSLRRMMRSFQADCMYVEGGEAALAAFADEPFDIVVSDMRMPEMDGATLLAKIADQYPETIRLVLTGYSEESLIMSAINEGRIWGFIHKPWDDNQLLATLQQAMLTQDLIAERALLKRTLDRYNAPKAGGFEGFIGNSAPMQLVYSLIERVGPSNASVFITGPSGAGKEVAAHAIHRCSDRKDKPFIALNCAAIPSELMESEIFGHVKGAFSGAVSNRDGAAQQAHEGTLFLDELAEMDINLQAKLLRFIQTGQVQKVGGTKPERFDIRFICATNRNPEEAIADGLLREDLFYRLAVVTLDMPPLRLRGGDPAILAEHFLQLFAEQEKKAFAGFSQAAQLLLNHYRWPGNVRQLRNCVHNLVVMNEGPLITENALAEALHLKPEQIAELLSESPAATAPSTHTSVISHATTAPPQRIRPLADVERETIEFAIDHCAGNVVQAAAALGVSPSTLYRKLQAWEKAHTST